jgi:hypothetical protein
MEGSPINRMRMANQGGVGRVFRAQVENGLKLPGGSLEK